LVVPRELGSQSDQPYHGVIWWRSECLVLQSDQLYYGVIWWCSENLSRERIAHSTVWFGGSPRTSFAIGSAIPRIGSTIMWCDLVVPPNLDSQSDQRYHGVIRWRTSDQPYCGVIWWFPKNLVCNRINHAMVWFGGVPRVWFCNRINDTTVWFGGAPRPWLAIRSTMPRCDLVALEMLWFCNRINHTTV
jgi:hypothetical protein